MRRPTLRDLQERREASCTVRKSGGGGLEDAEGVWRKGIFGLFTEWTGVALALWCLTSLSSLEFVITLQTHIDSLPLPVAPRIPESTLTDCLR